MRDWNALLAQIEGPQRTPLRPQGVIRAVSDALAADVIVTFDCGAHTHFASSTHSLSTCAAPGLAQHAGHPGLPYAIAAQLAFPKRQVVALVGDGGFAMLMAELTTAVQQRLPVKIVVLDNRALAQVVFEQKEAGFGNFGTDLGAIDFVAFAAAVVPGASPAVGPSTWRQRSPQGSARQDRRSSMPWSTQPRRRWHLTKPGSKADAGPTAPVGLLLLRNAPVAARAARPAWQHAQIALRRLM